MEKKFQFLEQDCTLTLAEGLAEYTSNYTFLNDNSGDNEESLWFRRHDYTHVIFGSVPFQLRGESINDLWTLFGSDMTFKNYIKFLDFVNYDTVMKSYYKRYNGKLNTYLKMLSYVPIMCVAIFRAWRMKKRWPWYKPEQFDHVPIAELRREFGIRVIAWK